MEDVQELNGLNELKILIFTGYWLRLEEVEVLRKEGSLNACMFLKCKKLKPVVGLGKDTEAEDELLDNEALCIPQMSITLV